MIGKIHGDWWDKTAEHSPEYKGLGVVLPLSGLLFLGVFLRFLFMAVAGNP